MGYLETQGVILRRQGIGTFVSQPSKENFLGSLERLEPIRRLAQKAGLSAQLLEREIISIEASEEIALLMGVPESTNLHCMKAVEAVEEKPTFFLINYLLPEIFDPADIQFTQRPHFEIMLESSQYAYTVAELFSILAEGEVAEKLQIDQGEPVMYMLETHLSASGDIIGISLVYSITDKFHFYVIRRPINV
jgi:GntR family transcriptional regulator